MSRTARPAKSARSGTSTSKPLAIHQADPHALKPSEYNPREPMGEKDRADLRASLERFGCVEPLVVNTFPGRENVLVGGHQ